MKKTYSLMAFIVLVFGINQLTAQDAKFESLIIYNITKLIHWPNKAGNFTVKIIGNVDLVKELKDFTKVPLKSGETKTLRFTIDKEKLSFFNQKLEWVAEPGEFELMIGASSTDIRLKDTFELTK